MTKSSLPLKMSTSLRKSDILAATLRGIVMMFSPEGRMTKDRNFFTGKVAMTWEMPSLTICDLLLW